MRSTCFSALALMLLFVALRISATPILRPNGPWSSGTPPPYPMPDLGPEELPPGYFDQFDNAHVLTEEVRGGLERRYQHDRKDGLIILAQHHPAHPPPEGWLHEVRRRQWQDFQRRVKSSIRYRLNSQERLRAQIKLEHERVRKLTDKACRLRQEAAECEEQAQRAENNIRRWTEELEALGKGSDEDPRSNANKFSLEGSVLQPVRQTLTGVKERVGTWGQDAPDRGRGVLGDSPSSAGFGRYFNFRQPVRGRRVMKFP